VLDIICWKWRPTVDGYRSHFGAHQVNVLRAMVARHYRAPHRFSCITDDATGIDGDVRIIPLWDDWKDVPSPHGGRNPSCYRRLKAWSAEAADIIGPRFVSVDLDCVITGDMRPVWDRPEDCVLWADALNPNNPYNGSMWLLRAGSRRHVWEDFEGSRSAKETRAMGYFGSDQAWYALKLWGGRRQRPDGVFEDMAARWTTADGVYSWRVHMAPYAFGGVPPVTARRPGIVFALPERGGLPPRDASRSRRDGQLPPGARIVFFHGTWDPWHPELMSRFDWIRENYRT
jgi:hypothetical protein